MLEDQKNLSSLIKYAVECCKEMLDDNSLHVLSYQQLHKGTNNLSRINVTPAGCVYSLDDYFDYNSNANVDYSHMELFEYSRALKLLAIDAAFRGNLMKAITILDFSLNLYDLNRVLDVQNTYKNIILKLSRELPEYEDLCDVMLQVAKSLENHNL